MKLLSSLMTLPKLTLSTKYDEKRQRRELKRRSGDAGTQFVEVFLISLQQQTISYSQKATTFSCLVFAETKKLLRNNVQLYFAVYKKPQPRLKEEDGRRWELE